MPRTSKRLIAAEDLYNLETVSGEGRFRRRGLVQSVLTGCDRARQRRGGRRKSQ